MQKTAFSLSCHICLINPDVQVSYSAIMSLEGKVSSTIVISTYTFWTSAAKRSGSHGVLQPFNDGTSKVSIARVNNSTVRVIDCREDDSFSDGSVDGDGPPTIILRPAADETWKSCRGSKAGFLLQEEYGALREDPSLRGEISITPSRRVLRGGRGSYRWQSSTSRRHFSA